MEHSELESLIFSLPVLHSATSGSEIKRLLVVAWGADSFTLSAWSVDASGIKAIETALVEMKAGTPTLSEKPVRGKSSLMCRIDKTKIIQAIVKSAELLNISVNFTASNEPVRWKVRFK